MENLLCFPGVARRVGPLGDVELNLKLAPELCLVDRESPTPFFFVSNAISRSAQPFFGLAGLLWITMVKLTYIPQIQSFLCSLNQFRARKPSNTPKRCHRQFDRCLTIIINYCRLLTIQNKTFPISVGNPQHSIQHRHHIDEYSIDTLLNSTF